MDELIKDKIKQQLKTLPKQSGVYIMKDKYGNIIYVGKAKVLKDRVTSYFRAFHSHSIKTQTMVANIYEFDYIITDTEMEALILEANLIKKHLPKFNVMLKDDKQYPFIRVTVKEKYPRVFMTRNLVKDGSRYFGPYTSADAVKQTLNVIHKAYPIRKTNKNIYKSGQRHCLNYHIGRCLGPCASDVDVELYNGMINDIIKFLSGNAQPLIKDLENKMMKSAQNLEFEKAAEYRNQIQAINTLISSQKIVSNTSVNQDIIAMAFDEDYACFMTFFIRAGKLIGRDEKIIENVEEMNESELTSVFVKQNYLNSNVLPDEIIVGCNYEDKELIQNYLSEKKKKKLKFTVPQKGKKAELLRMAQSNAFEYLAKYKERINKQIYEKKIIKSAFDEIFGVDINRIESYDISNISGVFTVASMVVYENFEKKKTDYRRFKVNTITGQDDYSAMREVIYRRFKHGIDEVKNIQTHGLTGKEKFAFFPDLLLIDGGKGQVNVVNSVLDELGVDIYVAGMVKNDRHITDKLYYNGKMYSIKQNNVFYSFLGKLQEEVHRFAIEYHKKLRRSDMVYSILEEISGVGKKRRIDLIKHFKSIDSIREASVYELMEVKGITEATAKNIYDYFRSYDVAKDKEIIEDKKEQG